MARSTGEKSGLAVPRSTFGAARLVKSGFKLVVHRHTLENVKAALEKRTRRAAKLAKQSSASPTGEAA